MTQFPNNCNDYPIAYQKYLNKVIKQDKKLTKSILKLEKLGRKVTHIEFDNSGMKGPTDFLTR